MTQETLTQDARRSNAELWAARISAMLEAPTKKEVPGRIWRLRFFDADGDYLVATMLQNIHSMPGTPTGAQPKVAVFLTRPYYKANISGGSMVTQQLFGEYSTDEIVAFLRLDMVDPDAASWRDETKYSNFIIVRDVLAAHGHRQN